MTENNQLAKTSFAYQQKRAGSIQRLLARSVPRQMLRRMKRMLEVPLDVFDALSGQRRELVPPRHLNFAGDGDFEANGDEFLRYFVELGEVSRTHRVLEVGSGIGRMARPLTRYLEGGSYDGIDIVPLGVSWCQKNITSRYPNFHFHLADVRNLMYNPKGRCDAATYQFPFNDGEFDFAFLTSVFTHMLREDMEHYLAEVGRLLRANGRCLVTYFLLNHGSRAMIEEGHSSMDFRFHLDGCLTDDDVVPEHAVAFEESYIRTLYGALGLSIETIRYGGWSGRSDYLSYQDIIIARRV